MALAAVVMGLPTLRGGFVGGDDHRLVLNHVLVSRPSLDHALELFSIVHRDLYQPLPLLTFSGEFWVAKLFGLFDSGVEAGAWLFHLTNVLLHALNTILVWMLIRTLHAGVRGVCAAGNDSAPVHVATVASLLFAIHPFAVEPVAWVNGRMMLLSTCLALAAMLAFHRWLAEGRMRLAAWVVLFALLSAVSKVRAPLPLLLAMIPMIARQRYGRRFWPVWIAVCSVTGLFVWVNIGATAQADLFAEGAEHLRGPRLVRIILALAFYFQHLLWPTGLTSYYPTAPMVAWTDPATFRAILVNAAALLVLGGLAWRNPLCRWGAAWFFIAIADTLPFFPARNILAADRYVYLPMVGIFWCLSVALVGAYTHWAARSSSAAPRRLAMGAAAVIIPALIGTSWYTAQWYNTPLQKTLRVAQCFPDEPRVWEKAGWSYHQAGQYGKAIECARKELRFEKPNILSGAYQLMGTSLLKLGRVDEGLPLLHQAVETDPDDGMAVYRLAVAYDELGHLDEAVPWYEKAAQAAPSHNPTLQRLANAYRKLARPDDARRLYEQALANNPYEVPAVMGLVELDIQTATREANLRAEQRLVNLLGDVPDDLPARINLGVVRYALGRPQEAAEAYVQVLRDHPREPTASLNLAQLLLGSDLRPLAGASDALRHKTARHPAVDAARALLALSEARYEEAVLIVQRLAALQTHGAKDARGLLLAALERFDERSPTIPWTLGLAAELLIADGNRDAARVFLDLFRTRCRSSACAPLADRLHRRLLETDLAPADPAGP